MAGIERSSERFAPTSQVDTVEAVQASPAASTAVDVVEVVSVAVFTMEYAVRVWVAVEDPDYGAAGPVRGRLRYMVRCVSWMHYYIWLRMGH
jgi:hypothetical protein